MASTQTDLNIQDKTILVALLLWFLLATTGAHRFYMGKMKSGMTMLVLTIIGWLTVIIFIGIPFLIATAVWWLIDLYYIFKFFDGQKVGVISFSKKSTESEESNLDSLLKLHNLYEKGVLNQTEYEDRKRKILSSGDLTD